MKFTNEKITSAQSMGASFTSESVLIDQIYGFSMQAVFTGSPVGTFKLQASNDNINAKFPQDVTNWTDIADSSEAISDAGGITWNFNGAFYRWVRVVYTRSSGSGSCDIFYSAKG
jgi:ABC-type phosphate transport system substrate-binding protein